MPISWDIFCKVIDNYGDIGVSWRLACQLVKERGDTVRLWVDDLAVFAVLQSDVNLQLATQLVAGIEVRHWSEPLPAVTPHQVVLEAFACTPPDSFLAAMAAARPQPIWINLDYLSAESWVEGCHGLGSRHPRLPLTHYFFFPGFTVATGGLLRAANLLQQREQFLALHDAPQHFLQSLGAQPCDLAKIPVSLFCYDNPALPALISAWQQSEPVCLYVAEGRPRKQVEAYLGRAFPPGSRVVRGNLTLLALPFLSQDDFDRLLWACDTNFVRGEDSFVRAQWAGKPFVWHIYPQEEDAHSVKLMAFMDRYTSAMPIAPRGTLVDLWLAWNRSDGAACVTAWHSWRDSLEQQAQAASAWCRTQAEQADLMVQLAQFALTKMEQTS